ncbi:uncharacterized protein B0T15DRAFT_224532 [Chaetomium strumarium]|uniref:Secreted protein n=1 Tax=Chaetomium strumarium TaxID=1170767 RepID=A0AAJ0GPW0_9PEZI|nr:hypothetical protein B0T15DRAFT_224532 [Chaetomium strumarium]
MVRLVTKPLGLLLVLLAATMRSLCACCQARRRTSHMLHSLGLSAETANPTDVSVLGAGSQLGSWVSSGIACADGRWFGSGAEIWILVAQKISCVTHRHESFMSVSNCDWRCARSRSFWLPGSHPMVRREPNAVSDWQTLPVSISRSISRPQGSTQRRSMLFLRFHCCSNCFQIPTRQKGGRGMTYFRSWPSWQSRYVHTLLITPRSLLCRAECARKAGHRARNLRERLTELLGGLTNTGRSDTAKNGNAMRYFQVGRRKLLCEWPAPMHWDWKLWDVGL